MRDGLAPVLGRVESADALILGSPVYLGGVSGEMQSFLERLIFSRIIYTDPPESLFPRRIPAAIIYTMNVTEEQMAQFGYGQHFALIERLLRIIFGSGETLLCCDTCQFEDYSRVVAPRFDPAMKSKRRREVFPEDCRRAFELGARLAG